MLMAELERGEHGDTGRARAWMLRAVRARHDPVWTADGYVSDRWRPVSPVTGRLDAFQWQTPLAALPSDKHVMEASPFEEAMLAPPAAEPVTKPAVPDTPAVPEGPAAQDNSPAPATEPAPPASRSRPDFAKGSASAVPPVVPIVRAPDDPGIDDEPATDEFAEPTEPARSQAGGWRGFFSRWGG
jgi:HemY protein